MTKVVKTSIEIPREILAKVKSLATIKGTTQNKIMNDLIIKGLKTNEKGKTKARIINHEMPGYDPNKKLNSMGLIGIVEVDNPEKIDVQELKDSIHFKKELY
jgi:hypothetical protein